MKIYELYDQFAEYEVFKYFSTLEKAEDFIKKINFANLDTKQYKNDCFEYFDVNGRLVAKIKEIELIA